MTVRKHKGGESKHEGEEHEHRSRPHGTGYGRERAVYEEFLTRRWQGSVPPTAQAYSRAIQKWRQLPGSIVTTPADIGAVKTLASRENSKSLPQAPANDAGKGKQKP